MIVAFDLDGVIYAGARLIPGAAEGVARALALGHATYFITNNVQLNTVELVVRLQTLRLDADAAEVVCATEVTADVVDRLRPRPERVLVLGTDSIAEPVARTGIAVVRKLGKEPVDAVVLGIDTNFAYRHLTQAHRAIERDGAMLVAPNNDVSFATAGGTTPGVGAFVAALRASCGAEPVVVGKPAPHLFRNILEREGATAAELLVIGDNLYSDVGGAKAAGARSALVLTGVDSRADADALPAAERPDYIIERLTEIPFDAPAAAGPVAGRE
ncbi:MAG: HAD-IIA family hydrolase [Chloroflexota bacterium]|nr:HAD-IIA family hydrolase [Chloroflexota bacterium]